MTCRDEILKVASSLAKSSSTAEFTLDDILREMKNSSYKESTIRTHVASRMCANSPDNHDSTYDDLVRTSHGTYRLK